MSTFFTGLSVLVSAVLIIVGWFVSQRKDREHEKFKLRLQKRIEVTEALLAYQAKLFSWRQNGGIPGQLDNTDEWIRLTLLVQTYGKEDEIFTIRGVGEATGDDAETDVLRKIMNQLIISVRADLGY